MSRKKLLLGLALFGLVGAYLGFDLGRYLSLEAIRQAHGDLAALYAARPALVIGAYALGYVTVFALGLPAGAVMTMAGGALFGLVVGTVVVSLASTAGATLAFLASRYLFAEAVRRRWGRRLAEIDRGVERDGAFYLFTLRLIPAIPPTAINLGFGLTRLRTWTFLWVSQIGMLAGTLVFVNAGTQLATIESPADILTPQLWLSFVLLGLLPLAARKVVAGLRSAAASRWRRAHAPARLLRWAERFHPWRRG